MNKLDNDLTLYNCLVKSASKALALQHEDGSMPSGHNGPYFDLETTVRNTGHWLMTFLKVYSITKKTIFFDAAQKALDYLLSKKARPMKATFWHRKNLKKDFCNGLIGQAWTIEALIYATKYFDNPKILKVAKEVFLLHPFNKNSGLWRRVEIDGSNLSVDETFNHQLWFAASGCLLGQATMDKEIINRINIFMKKIETFFGLYPSGLIQHHLKSKNFGVKVKKVISIFTEKKNKKEYLSTAKDFLINKINKFLKINTSYLSGNHSKIKSKAVGYHQFNLYAFALLKKEMPQHQFWKSKKFKLLWMYANSKQYKKELLYSDFGYPYNPPGIEMAFALEIFGDKKSNKQKEQERWISKQIWRSFSFKSYMMEKGTKDPLTYAARIYEAIRLPDLKII